MEGVRIPEDIITVRGEWKITKSNGKFRIRLVRSYNPEGYVKLKEESVWFARHIDLNYKGSKCATAYNLMDNEVIMIIIAMGKIQTRSPHFFELIIIY